MKNPRGSAVPAEMIELAQPLTYTWAKFLHLWYHDWNIPATKVVEGFKDFRKLREQLEMPLA